MTPDQMRAVAAKLREDNPEVNAAMTANGRAAAVTIYALADAIEKVAAETPEPKRELVKWNEHGAIECVICGAVRIYSDQMIVHFVTDHPRLHDTLKKDFNE